MAEIMSLLELDLLACPKVKDIAWIVGIPLLKRLRLAEASPAAKQAKDAYFDRTTEIQQMTQGRCTCAVYELQRARYVTTKVRELQQAICAKDGIPLPTHLAPIQAGALTLRGVESDVLPIQDFQTAETGFGFPLHGSTERLEVQEMIA
jgi:hypothetical protein